jgi:hypothetical protein
MARIYQGLKDVWEWKLEERKLEGGRVMAFTKKEFIDTAEKAKNNTYIGGVVPPLTPEQKQMAAKLGLTGAEYAKGLNPPDLSVEYHPKRAEELWRKGYNKGMATVTRNGSRDTSTENYLMTSSDWNELVRDNIFLSLFDTKGINDCPYCGEDVAPVETLPGNRHCPECKGYR